QYQINEIITGLVGVVLIGASFWSSVRRNKRLTGNGRPHTTPRSAPSPN
ncbi:DUF475 domain-containing protein, partial [Streptomyces olivaceus]